MEFYLVTTKCGHVGKTSYMPITFPIKAENGREAARIAKGYPRVKRDHWDAILDCRKVDEETYLMQVIINSNDPYLHATSKQEQEAMVVGIAERIRNDNHQDELNKLSKKSSRPNLRYQKQKYDCGRNNYYYEEDCDIDN